MKNNKIPIYIIIILLVLFPFSCSDKGDNIPTYTVTYKDFNNIIKIDGYTEPLHSTTANCPLYMEGTINNLIEDGTYVEEGDILCVIEVPDLQIEYDEVLANYENSLANLTKLEADLNSQYAVLESQVLTNKADAQIAQLDSLQLEYSTPNQRRIKELELAQSELQRKKIEKKLETLKIIQQTELKRMEIEIQGQERRLERAKEQLESLTIRAPKSGLAIRAMSWLTGKKMKDGDNVWSNMPIVNIPNIESMKVIIKAPEAEFKSISVGDSVYYTFNAMPDNIAFGKITMKSPIGQQISDESKVKVFDIEASIDSTIIMPDPGFSANCNIVLNHERNVFAVPRIAVFDSDSIKIVYVKKNNGYEARQVITGLNSSKEVIVSNGLNDGEEILLLPPPESKVKIRTMLPDSIVKKVLPIEDVEQAIEQENNIINEIPFIHEFQ